MSDILKEINRIKEAMTLVGLNADRIHWQSVAVLLKHGRNRQFLIGKLFDAGSGWCTDGVTHHYDGYGCSLYLSPKGMPFFVGYGGHNGLYDKMMGCSQQDMNNAGWLHISDRRIHVYGRPSRAQLRWLENYAHEHGISWRGDLDRGDTPRPCAEAEPFDVRPADDWGRFEQRLLRPFGHADTL